MLKREAVIAMASSRPEGLSSRVPQSRRRVVRVPLGRGRVLRVPRPTAVSALPGAIRAVDGSPSMLQAAISYAARGIRILPVIHAGPYAKQPLLPHGHLDASSDIAEVTRWWQRWPNALIGFAIPGDIVVIDIDPRNRGSLAALEAAVGILPPTLTVLSGRGDGGCHLYFQRPSVPLRGKFPGIAGIDVKTNGYVIVPPSRHPETGHQYSGLVDEADPAIAPLPSGLLDALTPHESSNESRASDAAGSRAVGRGAMTSRLFIAWLRRLENEVEGNRNERLFRYACQVVEAGVADPGMDVEWHLDTLGVAAVRAGLKPEEAQATIASAKRRAS
jgi:hypothetical protein